jgi:PAS domain S-box-containing protein
MAKPAGECRVALKDHSLGSPLKHRWKRSTVDAMLLAGIICVLIICGTVTFQSIQRIRANSNLVAQTHESIGVITQLESALTNAETAQRGYIITGDKEYLRPFTEASNTINLLMERLQEHLSKNDQHLQEIELLKSLVEQKMNEVGVTITLRGAGLPGAAENVVRNDTGKHFMDEIREQLAAMRMSQEQLLGKRAAATDQTYFLALLAALTSTVVGLGLVAAVFWTVQNSREKAEAAAAVLYAQHERMQVTLSSIGDGVIVCDHACRVTFLNPVSENLTGWSNSDAAGLPLSTVFNIVSEGTRSPVESPAVRALRDGKIVGLANHTLLISRQGAEIPIDDSASPIRDAQRNVSGVVLVFRDVTQRRNEERRLYEAAEFTRSIVDTLGELVVVLDHDMQVLHVNRAFSTTLQITDDRVMGRSIYQIDEGQWDVPEIRELLNGAMNAADPAAHIEIERQLNRVGRKSLRLTASRFAAGSDRNEAVLLVISDVTDERLLEEKNRRQNQHMRWFLEQIKDYAIFTMDADCRATSWNQGVKHVLGFEEDEFIGHDIRKLIFTPEAQAAEIPETEFSLAALDQRASDDRWMMRKGGETFWASGITSSIRDQHDHLIGYSKVMRDLTSSKEAQDGLTDLATRLAEVDRRKDEFLATLAHELRNPLAPIKNAVQLMGLTKLDPETDELRQMMARQVEQLVRLIDDLLDVSRINRGKISLRNEVVDLSAVIAAAVEASTTFIAESGQQLTVNIPEGSSIYVSGDPSRLTQVISNLLNNSAKYSDAGCHIELTATLEDQFAAISVRDNGIGIAPELLQSIFQMFAQVDDTLERGSAGLGIGLTLVKTLVELHEGTVVAHSDGVGKGSVFTVRIPAITPPEVSVASPSEYSAVTTARSFKVLVVEDMRALRVIMSRLLTKLGHEVEFAEDGTLALQKLETFHPDVVFSDIAMPGMTGYELARRIRERPECANICLVALTGFGQSADRDKALAAGFDEHMVKPVDLALLQVLFDSLSCAASSSDM